MRMSLVMLAALLVLVSALSISCKPKVQATGPVQYPKDWPIPQLTVPPGSRPGTIPAEFRFGDEKVELGYLISPRKGYQHYTWVIGFTGDYSFTDLLAHIDSVLLPLGFKITEPDQTTSNDRSGNITLPKITVRFQTYQLTGEKSAKITVEHERCTGGLAIPKFETYAIIISSSDKTLFSEPVDAANVE